MKKYKNYGTLLIITTAVFYITWWCLVQYQIANDYSKNISLLEKKQVLTFKVNTFEEMNLYVKENADAWVYVANTHQKNTGMFEKRLTAIVNKYQLNSNVVLFNISANNNIFDENLKPLLMATKNTKLLQTPMLLYFKDGQLIDGLDYNNHLILKDNLTIKNNNANDNSLSERDLYNFMLNYHLIESKND